MQKYCQLCGSPLSAVGEYVKFWIRFYECSKACESRATYLEVVDLRWVYPLQMLELGVLRKALSSSEEMIELAVRRIKRIDYKTISIVYFERTILGIYEEGKEYQVVYPESKA